MTLVGSVEQFNLLRDHALGWRGLIDGLRYKLDKLDVNVKVRQVKEKFGLLRVYAGALTDVETDERLVRYVDDLIEAAELTSSLLCYLCGAGTTHRGTGWWVRYFCADHDTVDLYTALGRRDLVERLGET